METRSESLIKKANALYFLHKRAKVTKNEVQKRYINGKLIYSGSSGLDFSGVDSDGKYISFEVKETEKEYIPINNIQMSQIYCMEQESKFSDPFLVVLFKKINEWYRIDYSEIKYVLKIDPASLPIRLFRAFGYMIPIYGGLPLYLDGERHPLMSQSMKEFPLWIPKRRQNQRKQQISKIDYSDKEIRDKRIIAAIKNGAARAENKEKYKR